MVSSVLKFAVNEGYIQVNPVESMRGGKELRSISQKTFTARAVTAAEAQAIISHLPAAGIECLDCSGCGPASALAN